MHSAERVSDMCCNGAIAQVSCGPSSQCMGHALCTPRHTNTKRYIHRGKTSPRTKLECIQAAGSHPHLTHSHGTNTLRFCKATSRLASTSGMAGAGALRSLLAISMVRSRHDLLPCRVALRCLKNMPPGPAADPQGIRSITLRSL